MCVCVFYMFVRTTMLKGEDAEYNYWLPPRRRSTKGGVARPEVKDSVSTVDEEAGNPVVPVSKLHLHNTML